MQSIAKDSVHTEVLAPITHAGVKYAPGTDNVFLPQDAFDFHQKAGAVKRASRKQSSDDPVDPPGERVSGADPALAGVPEGASTDVIEAPGLGDDGTPVTRGTVTTRTANRR